MDTNKENLQNWIFNYNPYKNEWRACKRDNYLELFSNQESKNTLKSKNINTIIKFITKENQ